MPEKELSKLLRKAFALWSVLSAAGSGLISVYKFLSAHGQLVPGADASTSAFTIVVNGCLLAALLMAVGGMSGVFFVCVSTRIVERGDWEMFIVGIVVRVFVLALGIISLVSPGLTPSKVVDHIVGIMCLAAIVSYLSPAARWIEQRSEPAMLLVGLIITTALLTSSASMQGLWHMFLNGPEYDALIHKAGRDFTLIPLSSMTIGLWCFAVFGGGICLNAYIAFKEWRNKGKNETD
jgi:hypothetical protein